MSEHNVGDFPFRELDNTKRTAYFERYGQRSCIFAHGRFHVRQTCTLDTSSQCTKVLHSEFHSKM
jgi:hypothetical protein